MKIPQVIRDLLSSKKAVMALLSAVAMAVSRLGLELDTEVAWSIISPLLAYVLGQSVVDARKAALPPGGAA